MYLFQKFSYKTISILYLLFASCCEPSSLHAIFHITRQDKPKGQSIGFFTK